MTNIDGINRALGNLMLAAREEYPEPWYQMVEDRFPFTYAYDCVRAYPRLVDARFISVNELGAITRGDASQILDRYAEANEITKADACVAFAAVYCHLENIRMDGERYDEVLRMMAEDKTNAEIVEAGHVRRMARWDREGISA